jgi:uncharacterized membrane protein
MTVSRGLPRRWHCTEALVNTFRDLGRRASTTVPVAALLALPVLLVSLAGWTVSRTGRFDLRSIVLVTLMFLAAWLFTGLWLQASIIVATRDYATGAETGIGKIIGSGLGRIPSLLGTLLLVALLWIGVVLLASVPVLAIVFAGVASGDIREIFEPPLLIGFIMSIFLAVSVFAFLGFVLFMRYTIAPMVNVLERKSPADSLDRARELMKGRWLDFFLLAFMVALVGGLINLVLTGPSLVVQFSNLDSAGVGRRIGPFLGTSSAGLGAAVVIAISTYLGQIALPIVTTGAYTNFYLGLRADEARSGGASLPGGGGLGGTSPAPQHHPDPSEEQHGAGQDPPARDLPE